MNRENVNPNFKFGDSDAFQLTDLDTDESLMLIPCDTAGNFSWTGVTRAPLQRNALKTSNTSNQYSDLEPPWISIPQENWTGGRANDIFTKDTTRYRDGKRAQAAYNEVIYNGPLDYYSQGFRKAETNCPGSMSWRKMLPGKERYIAVTVRPKVSLLASELYIHLRRRGTPASSLVVELVNSLTATTALASHTYTITEINDTLSEFAKFTFNPVALSSNTNYYIRIHCDAGTTDDHWEVGYKVNNQRGSYYSADGINYNSGNFEIYYRIAEEQTGYKTKFFTYEQMPFMLRQKIGSTPTLWINGDIGKATAATPSTITDSTKSWDTNIFKGARVGIVYRNGSEEHVDTWRTITGNTSNSLTVDRPFDIIASANFTYVIVDTPIWQQITGHGLTSYVTDVHVIRGVVYFAQGDYVDARKMRWHDGAFEWQTMTGIKASFFQSVRDRNGMMMYRAMNDGINHKRTVERARLLDWRTSNLVWTKITTALTTKDSYNKTVIKNITTKESEPQTETVTTTVTTADVEPATAITKTTKVSADVEPKEEHTNTTVTTENIIDGDHPDQTKTVVSTDKAVDVGSATYTSNTTSTATRTESERQEDNKHITTVVEETDTTKNERNVDQPITSTVTTTKQETINGVVVTTGTEVAVTSKNSELTVDGDNKTTTTTEETTITNNDRSVELPTSSTVTTQKTGTIDGQQVTSSETVAKSRNQTVAVSGGNKTTTTTETTTTTTSERTVVKPTSTYVKTENKTVIDGVIVDNETIESNVDISEAIVDGQRVITTSETNTATSAVVPSPPLRTSIATESKDFSSGDYDAQQYKITIENFASDNMTGQLVLILQESEDNQAFHNVETVIATGTGVWRMSAKCKYQYRRFVVTAVGTNCIVNNISITTDDIMHFEDPVFLLDNYGKITRLFEYGSEQEKSLWIFQEGMVSSINKTENTVDTYNLDRINLDELQVTADQWNGKAVNSTDVYLLWGWLNGLQRYYNTQIEGKGPDHDEGLPFDRQGRVTQIISYPSNFFISIDAEDGYSCVMQFNQSGWHEIYRAPNAGERIYDMAFQPIYGNRPDRLWLNVGDDVVWLAMPSKILYAIQDQYAEYTHESVLVSAWHTAGMSDIEKLWQTLKIMADYLDGKNCWIEADYQTDDEETWHPIENWYTVSPSQKEDLNPYRSVNGKKLRYRLRLQSTDIHKTPKVNAVVLEAVGRVDIKMSYTFYFRNIKYKRDLNAEFEDIEPLEVQNVLDSWANQLKKLRLNSRWKIFDDKLVYLDAVQTSVLNELSEGYIGQITLNEL